MACEEAELGPDQFSKKLQMQHKLHEQVEIFSMWINISSKGYITALKYLQQLEMLKHMRKFHLDDQSAILDKVHLCFVAFFLFIGLDLVMEIGYF